MTKEALAPGSLHQSINLQPLVNQAGRVWMCYSPKHSRSSSENSSRILLVWLIKSAVSFFSKRFIYLIWQTRLHSHSKQRSHSEPTQKSMFSPMKFFLSISLFKRKKTKNSLYIYIHIYMQILFLTLGSIFVKTPLLTVQFFLCVMKGAVSLLEMWTRVPRLRCVLWTSSKDLPYVLH